MKKYNWLLIRGLAREAGHWGDFPRLLGNQVFSQSVVALDLPGIGTEKNRNTPLTIRENVEDLRLRWQNKSSLPWAVIGISMGGMIAMDWIFRYPGDFSAGVFINTSSRGTSTLFQRLRPQYIKRSIRSLMHRDIEEREKEILKITSNLKCNDIEAQRMWIEIAKKNSPRLSTIVFQLIASAQFSAPRQLPLRSLFLTSKADRMVDYRSSQKLSELYSAQLHIHEVAGHDLPLDDPNWILQKIKDFILLTEEV
ncbi:MAG: hypothetical protein A4S09_14260 [Proteobacteria bacterium SG_bin7]|nr:MAG: hypothetical protein A4S09_14260 [Proteobacteria bacterium SG_bin7]